MKKIILGIITIMLAVTIFGCGKAQQASGGGSSGGGGGNGGGGGGNGDSPAVFTISGTAQIPTSIDDNKYASLPVRFGRGLANLFISPAHAADLFKPLKNADVKIFEFGKDDVVTTAKTGNDGRYTVSLQQGKIYEVVIEKAAADGSATINIKNIAHEKELEVDVTPVTSVAVEAILKNPEVKAALLAVNSGAGDSKPDVSAVTGIIETAKEKVEEYYAKPENQDALNSINENITSTTPPALPPITIIEEYALNITVSPNSSAGSVEKTPTPNGSNGKYLEGTKVKLLAKSSEGYAFKEWSGGGLTGKENPKEITMGSTKNIMAVFTRTDGARPVAEITDIDSWAWDESWQGEDATNLSSKPLDNTGVSGAKIHGLKVGKKDGKLYFMAKLSNNEAPSENLRYQVVVVVDENNYDNMAFVNITHGYEDENEGWISDNWRASSWKQIVGHDGAESVSPNPAELVSISADIIVAAIPISTITDILGDKPNYVVFINTAPLYGQGNYYALELRKIAF
jgi:hypothetical protein